MYIEYFINTVDIKDIDIKNSVDTISKIGITNICCFPYVAKIVKKFYTKSDIGLLTDYPLGNNTTNTRQFLIDSLIESNYKYINIPIQFHLMINRKYDKIRDDMKMLNDLATRYNAKIRYILEYRKFDHNLLLKICEICIQNNINDIYPSSGFFLDNIDDNIIACAYLNKKTGINTIINGNTWTKQQIQNIINSGMYGFSTNNISSLQMFKDFYNEKQEQQEK